MELPTGIVKASRKSPGSLILYGAPKVGKTTVLSQLKNCLIIDTENGSDFIDAIKVKINSLAELTDVCKKIIDAKCPYDYVAIDTIDRIEELCDPAATITYKNSILGKRFTEQSVLELPQGGGYYWLRREFFKYINNFPKLAKNIILISHLREKMIEENGKEVTERNIDLTGKIRGMTCSRVDAIGYLYRGPKDELRVSFRTRPSTSCGNRAEHLAGQDFEFSWDRIYIE